MIDNSTLKIGDIPPKPPAPRSESEIMANWEGDISKPLVSIVCYTYNHVDYISDALNGFLMQETDFPFEIIVHDDASTDGTTTIVKKYAEAYPNIIVSIIQKENQWSQGLTPRAFTFPLVKGKFISLCEGDDYWIAAYKLQKQVQSFEYGVSLVFHDSIRVEDDIVKNTSYYDQKKPLYGYNSSVMASGCKIPTASALFLSSPLKSLKQPNIINGDHFIWAMSAKEGTAKFIDEKLSVYRHHKGGVWSNRKAINKVEPALKSKKTIFKYVPTEFKLNALIGYISMGQELIRQLIADGEPNEAQVLYKELIVSFYKMSIQSPIYRPSKVIDYIKANKIMLSTTLLVINSYRK